MRASTRSPTRVWTRPGEPGPTFGVYQLHEELDSDDVSLVHRATEHGSQAGVALQLANLGLIQQKRGDVKEALESLRQARLLHGQLGDRVFEARDLNAVGTVLWTRVASTLMDVNGPHAGDGLDVAIWAFFLGGAYGALFYFLGGLVVYALTRLVGGITYRQARHVLAFASAPVALSLLVLWPVRLAVYGEDLFRTGGSDHGAGNTAFVVLELLVVVWSLALLVLGLRAVRGQPGLERS